MVLVASALMNIQDRGVKYLQNLFPMGCVTHITTKRNSDSMVVIAVTTHAEAPLKIFVARQSKDILILDILGLHVLLINGT
jgi:hypothetical protein